MKVTQSSVSDDRGKMPPTHATMTTTVMTTACRTASVSAHAANDSVRLRPAIRSDTVIFVSCAQSEEDYDDGGGVG